MLVYQAVAKFKLASFRKIALTPLRLLFEPHSERAVIIVRKADARLLQRFLDADDGRDVALRRPIPLLNPRNGDQQKKQKNNPMQSRHI